MKNKCVSNTSGCNSISTSTFQVYWNIEGCKEYTNLIQPLNVSNVKFIGNTAMSLLHVVVNSEECPLKVYFKRVHFCDNVLAEGESFIYISSKSKENKVFEIEFNNVIVTNNNAETIHRIGGIFNFFHLKGILFHGECKFINNIGSVLNIVNSNLHLYGGLYFQDNTAIVGAGIKLKGWSYIYLYPSLNATFENNSAMLSGGAIYAEHESTKILSACVFQFESVATNYPKLNFIDNDAKVSGKSIFAYPIFECILMNFEHINSSEIYEKYTKAFHFHNKKMPGDQQSQNIQELSTIASNVEFTLNDPDCAVNQTANVMKYPGEKIALNLRTFDAVGRHVHSVLRVVIEPINVRIDPDVRMIELLEEDGSKNFSFSLTSTDLHNVTVTFSLSNDQDVIYKIKPKIQLQSCPLGFHLSNSSGSCKCSKLLFSTFQHKGCNITCDINQQSFTRPITLSGSWIGHVKYHDRSKKFFALSMSCPMAYCNSKVAHFTKFKVSGSVLYIYDSNQKASALEPMCIGKREGVLCGSCKENFSTIFGSTECRRCSNWWLLTVFVYSVIGVVTVYFLYTFKLTLVSGTLNGIIFIGQICYAGVTDILDYVVIYSHNCTLKFIAKLCEVLISIININPYGIPMCFYNGMTHTMKAYFSLLFPVYLLSIILIIALLSKRYTWISSRITNSSVQVMVTVLHLSFSKLLLTIIDVFAYSEILIEADERLNKLVIMKVWYWDGSLEYMKNSHLWLSLVSLVIIIPLILPYTLLLIFSKILIKHSLLANKYLRPFYEAIHAPYKPTKEYFFTLRLILLITIYIVYALCRASNPAAISVCTIPLIATFLVLQMSMQPYKNVLITYLDSWIIFLYLLGFTVVWYYLTRLSMKSVENSAAVCCAAVIHVFMIAVIVFIGHIPLIKNRLPLIQFKLYTIGSPLLKYFNMGESNNLCQIATTYKDSDSFYGSCNQFREPCLND